MTPEQQAKCRRIAEIDGWKPVTATKDANGRSDELWSFIHVPTGTVSGFLCGLDEEHAWRVCCPKFTTSYDAIIPVIQRLPLEIRQRMFADCKVTIMATPEQLCDAVIAACEA